MRMRNLRLGITFEQAINMGLGGGEYPLDAYNDQVLLGGVIYAVTTRTFGDNNHFLLEVYE